MEYKDLFKATGIRSLGELLAKRCESIRAERQERQREFFWGGVVASDDSPCTKEKEIVKTKNSRIEMLKKWKSEKMKRLEEAKKKQKPAFKVGVVQRKVTGSPMFTQRKACVRNNLVSKQCHVKSQISDSKDKKTGVITRARARAIKMAIKPVQSQEVNSQLNLNNKFYKIDKNKKQPVNSCTFKVPEVVCKLPCSSLTLAYSPKLTKKSKKLVLAKIKAAGQSVQSKDDVPKKNFLVQEASAQTLAYSPKLTKKSKKLVLAKVKASGQSTTTVQQSKEDVPKENLSVQKENSQMKTPEKPLAEQDDFRPIYYSPFVTIRSSKKSARKSKNKLTIDVEEQIKKEEREFQCRIFSFRKYIECETRRLMETCDKWKHIYEEFPELPADVEGDIDSAIGKTKLLTSDKFNQFRGLIDKCENGDPLVKVDDLQGYQDWVSIEVERIDEEFHKLENRKRDNWKQEIAPPSQVAKKLQVKPVKNTAKKPAPKSSIRSHILAARKLLREGKGDGGDGSRLPVTFPAEESIKPKTPRKEKTLLREVLNAERKSNNESSAKKLSAARESRNSGLEIMMATQKNKFPTPAKLQKSPVVTDYEVLFGQEQTPNRSILKKTPKAQSSSKPHVTFKNLSEKYFQPVVDSDEDSPMRTVLGDLGNLTVGGMRTRSRSRQMSSSASISPLVK